nr:pentapeptide repeat-containing protein [Myxococcus sp. CA040A]
MLLLDARRRADPTGFLVRGLPKAVARERVALAKKSSKADSPLHAELGGPPVWEAAWHAEHTPRFVARSRLLARHNAVGEGRLQKIIDEISPLEQKGKGLFLDAAWARLHHFDVSVEVTDEKYLQHLVEGHVFGTTAYDAWIEKQLPPKKKVSAKKPKLVKQPLVARRKGDFSSARLKASFWASASLGVHDVSGSSFRRTNLVEAGFVSGVKALKSDFTEARLTRSPPWKEATTLQGWNLKGSSFKGAKLFRVEFEECDLRDCDFTQADLRHARFLSCNLKGAIFNGANLTKALIPPEHADKAKMEGARNYRPPPGGKPGSACLAFDRLMTKAKAIEFEVRFASPNERGEQVLLTLGPRPTGPKRIMSYQLMLGCRRNARQATPTSVFSTRVGYYFGPALRRLSDQFSVPPDRRLDLSTLTVSARSLRAPLEHADLLKRVRAALSEVLVAS